MAFRRKNFPTSTAFSGKKHTEEATRLLNECLLESPVEHLCFKARMSVPTFFTKAISKFPIKDSFISALIRIPQLWKTGELDELFLEGHGVKVGPGPRHPGPRVPPQSLKVGPQDSLQNLKVGLQDPLTFL